MHFKKLLPHLSLILGLTLVAALAVRAGFADSLQVKNVDAEAFPRIVAELTGDELDQFSVKHIQLSEMGEVNHGPMVYLPPAPQPNLVDLFVLLDHTGNTAAYAEALELNLKALVQNMREAGMDVKVYFTTFSSPDSPIEQAPNELLDQESLVDYLNQLGLNGPSLVHAFGLNKLYHFSSLAVRPGAEKMALVLNGTPFYTHESHPNQTTYTIADTINQLVQNQFIVFVAGSPFKALHALKNEQVEDASLSHAMAGGYLGGFATDLSVIVSLLQARLVNQGVLMYYSNLPENETGPIDFYIQGELASSFYYPALNRSDSVYFTHLNTTPVQWGDPVTIAFRVNPIHQLVGLVEFFYLNKQNQVQRQWAEPKLMQNNDQGLYYQVQIDPYDHPQEYFRYNVIAHTPFGPIGDNSDLVSLPVAFYDEGITVESTLTDNAILWKWSGPTVDLGSTYRVWMGDEMVDELTEKQLQIPVSDCLRYQVVQVQVKLPANANHPLAGQWSQPSPPFEAYLGPNGVFTEKQGLEHMLACVENPAFASLGQLVQTLEGYNANGTLYLEKALYYLTLIAHPESASELELGRYRLLYFVLGWISEAEHDQYDLAFEAIPQSLLYKAIAQVNHAEDRQADLKWGLHELFIRLQGHPSI